MIITNETIARLRELNEKATPGPYRYDDGLEHIDAPSGVIGSMEPASAPLFVEAVNVLPALLDIVEDLRRQRLIDRDELNRYQDADLCPRCIKEVARDDE